VITLRDGAVIEDEIAVANAHPLGATPWTVADYVRKFRLLSEDVLDRDEVERFLALAKRLPTLTAAELPGLGISAPPGTLAVGPAGLF
jgi:2-methylcitrate dehydratase